MATYDSQSKHIIFILDLGRLRSLFLRRVPGAGFVSIQYPVLPVCEFGIARISVKSAITWSSFSREATRPEFPIIKRHVLLRSDRIKVMSRTMSYVKFLKTNEKCIFSNISGKSQMKLQNNFQMTTIWLLH